MNWYSTLTPLISYSMPYNAPWWYISTTNACEYSFPPIPIIFSYLVAIEFVCRDLKLRRKERLKTLTVSCVVEAKVSSMRCTHTNSK
jgi:hypothetical protein